VVTIVKINLIINSPLGNNTQEEFKMSKIISISNQKGGVGKTTTAMNLGAALELAGKKVLLIDLDPQANLSSYLGYEGDDKPTIIHLMMNVVTGNQITSEDFTQCVRYSEDNHISYIPADINLANADFYLSSALSRETVLRRVLTSENLAGFDYVLIDCLPSLGVLLTNALTASDGIVIPVQTQKFALDGLSMLTNIYEQIKTTINPKIELIGVLATMADVTNMSKSVLDKLAERYQDKMFGTVIHKSIEAANSSEKGKSLCLYKSKLGEEYKALAEEVIKRLEVI
jgi:chromosome partitioning protein